MRLDTHEFTDGNIQDVEVNETYITIFSTEHVNDLSIDDLDVILSGMGYDIVKRKNGAE
jgi:hypothetical protein